MRAFLVLFGGLLALASIVLSILGLSGKLPTSIGLIVFLIAMVLISIGRKFF